MATTTPSGASRRATARKTTATVRDFSTRYSTRNGLERELRQRRRGVERTSRQNRRRLEREVRLVRRDLGKQSDTLSGPVEKILGEAQGRLSSVA